MDVLDTGGALTPDSGDNAPDDALAGEQGQSRDYEAEALGMGWRPLAEFKGDPAKHMDAKLYVERGETFLPFIKKDRDETKRELAELKRTVKQAAAHYSKVEERAYARAKAELEAKHEEAVETGDVAAAKAAVKELGELEKPAPVKTDEPAFDPVQARKELNAWVEDNDWYILDDGKRRYADLQAETMGPATEWPDGNKAWLDELAKRVERKFAERKPNVTNGGGNRAAPGGGGKTYNDLPAAAKAACDKFVKSGLIASREAYVKDYDFG